MGNKFVGAGGWAGSRELAVVSWLHVPLSALIQVSRLRAKTMRREYARLAAFG